ncbi:deoxyxylulose-5-phosphate synthase [Streptomyces sp. NPDC007905]|uniref:deoxyxylulose-5-phosphate synthase n=1 Tax=Streptomyces sp. NPDC007905 TaxID=3364788 RepID=UPI0036EA07BC
MPAAKTSYVCLSCRVSYKQSHDPWRAHVCPGSAGALMYAGSAFAAPPKRDRAARRTLTVLLHARLGFHKVCGGGPGYRPRTPREVRERLEFARRTGEPAARVLARAELP